MERDKKDTQKNNWQIGLQIKKLNCQNVFYVQIQFKNTL